MPYSRILLNTEQLDGIVSRLAREISSDCCNKDDHLALVVLEGARYFATDLLKQIVVPMDVEHITASSYSGIHSTGNVTIDKTDTLGKKIRNRNILLIDDIYDTGLTLSQLLQCLKQYQPKSIKTCVLLEKQTNHTKDIEIDFLGTTIEDEFLIGYGFDYNGQYRELPFVGVLSNELIKQDSPEL